MFFALFATSTFAEIFNAEEYKLFSSSWNTVKHNEVDILYYVFKNYPEMQARFPAFVGKDLDSIKGSAAFALHATRIVSFLSDVVQLMSNEGNDPAINTVISQLAANHKNRGITKPELRRFGNVLVEYLKENVPQWNEDVAAVWNTAMETNYGILFSHFDRKSMH